MKLTAKQIENVKFTLQEKNGYSCEDVDNFLDKVLADYEELEKTFSYGDIYISSQFNGSLLPNSVIYEGTIAQWEAIENKGILENIPCINCRDGLCIQKL